MSVERRSVVGAAAAAVAAGLAVVAVLVLASAATAAPKGVSAFLGNPSTDTGALGGRFSTPRGVAVNVAGVGGAGVGDVYVVDSSNNRVQRFSSSGGFVSAWGRDVDTGGVVGYEVCVVAANCKAAASSTGLGGELNAPQGIAVDQATGNVYVTDQAGFRVQVFTATGSFVRAFGQDVVSTGLGNNPAASAVRSLTIAPAVTDGTYTLSFRGQVTGPIAWNADATTVQTALRGLSTIGATGVNVTGAGPFTITFAGSLANAPMAPITADSTNLVGGTATVGSTVAGSTGFEVCSASAGDICKAGVSASTAGAFLSTFSGHVAVASSGNVLVADPGNRRVNEYTSGGAFVRSFGFDVTSSPPNATTTFEICAASDFDVCKIAAASGSGTGQFGTNGPNRVAVDSAGVIYTVEQASPNFRVQRFTPAGSALTPVIFNPTISAVPAVSLSGTATSDTPTDIAITASNNVAVTKVCTAVNCPGASLATERRVYEFTAGGVLNDTQLANAAIGSANGLAASAAARLYVSSTSVGNPSQGFHRVYSLTDIVAPPAATIAATDGVGATTATLHGTVNPGGVLAGYHFEYVDHPTYVADGNTFASAASRPDVDADAGAGTSASAVTRTVTGLAPNTLYHVRLVAKQSYGAASAVSVGAVGDFTTGPAKPTVAAATDADASTTSATLSGRVNPNGQATSYRFDYGPTTSYGSSTADQSAGAGIKSVYASAEIADLEPGTTYHYRLVATNATGVTEGLDHTFTTGTPASDSCANAQFRKGLGQLLPDCRGYEQVSPTAKGGFDAGASSDFRGSDRGGPTALDGSAAAFTAPGPFGSSEWGGTGALFYVARRSEAGWDTASFIRRPPVVNGLFPYYLAAHTPDLNTSVIVSLFQPLTDDPASSTNNYYLRNNDNGISALAFAYPGSAPSSGENISADGKHFVFGTSQKLTDDPGELPSGGTNFRVYDYHDGAVHLVSRQPGTDVPFAVASNPGSDLTTGRFSNAGVVSDNGSQVFFTAPPTGDARVIYRRSNGTTTAVASPTKRTTPDPTTRAKVFETATADGNRVFFSSRERLTDDANDGTSTDLYRYDFDADELIDLTATTPGTTPANIEGVVDISDDGSRAYFVARGQILPPQGTSGASARNLYLWEDDGTAQGVVRFVASLDSVSTGTLLGDNKNWSWDNDRMAATSPDGRYLVLQSRANLTGYAPAGTSQVYLYSANASGGAGALTCVSCGPGLTAPVGNSFVPSFFSPGLGQTDGNTGRTRQPLALTSGGGVLFSTRNALVGRDTNGKYDAYLWEKGELALLSSGKSSDDSWAFGTSVSGDDVFFRTRESLVPGDGDTLVDLYTARVGGGLASQNATPASDCDGDGCRELSPAPPPASGVGSADDLGRGNLEPLAQNCAKFARAAKRLTTRALGVRRKAARSPRRRQAVRLRRQATRLSKQAKGQRAKAKRCTQRNRGTGK